ncbi:MAG: hypothetical protein DRP10_03525 [Candidatus Aenigmatarchaeota archaeon]|nr:MAG: hypothetical protein DRP10_03525 [Candidatus Aenigmarchaeota archaeon]
MTYNTDTRNATYTLPLDITNPFLSPGPHWIKVCANDTVGNENCTWSPSPYVIKIVNASQLETLVENNLSLDAFNITYENGTDIGLGTNIPAMNPVEYNYTIHFSKNEFEAFIYGMQINETLAAKMTNNNFTLNLPSMEATIQNLTLGITDIASVWIDVSSYLPTESFYKYGEIVLNDTYDAVFYCSTPTNCTQISVCNATEVNLSNYATVIPNESSCYINNVSGDNKTHIYVDHFSGGAGAKDTTAPTISFSCTPTSVYVGETITCSCSATDNLDPNPQVSYTAHPSTSSVGTFTTTCTAIDSAGNKNSKSISYTVRSKPSGGGGGGTYTPLPKQINSWTKITPGVATIMKITKKEIGLKQIQIEVKNPANNVRITVTKLEGKPASVKQEISGKVYKYLEINAENLNETNLEEAKIQFEVNKTWVLENNLDKNRIYLYRFVNNEWQKLTTRLLNETDNYINYEAETPGFSYFAIGGEEKVCEEGKKRCSNNNLEQCINNSWKLIETCNYGCNETTLTCNPKPTEKICEEGTKRCVDNNLQECENGEWKTIETCEYGCNSTSLTCNQAPVTAEKPEEIKKKDYTWIYVAITAIIILAGLGYYFLVYKKK